MAALISCEATKNVEDFCNHSMQSVCVIILLYVFLYLKLLLLCYKTFSTVVYYKHISTTQSLCNKRYILKVSYLIRSKVNTQVSGTA